jgi:hypothetical protein
MSMDGRYSLVVGNKQGCMAMDGRYSLVVGNKQGCMAMDGRYSLVVGNCLIDLIITEFCRNRVNVIQADGLVAGFIWQF